MPAPRTIPAERVLGCLGLVVASRAKRGHRRLAKRDRVLCEAELLVQAPNLRLRRREARGKVTKDVEQLNDGASVVVRLIQAVLDHLRRERGPPGPLLPVLFPQRVPRIPLHRLLCALGRVEQRFGDVRRDTVLVSRLVPDVLVAGPP